MTFDVDANASLPAFPTTQDELWRYSRIEDLHLERYSETPSAPSTAMPEAAASLLPAEVALTILMVNGRRISTDGEPKGATVSSVSAGAFDGDDYFERLNAAKTPEVTQIEIASGAYVEAPIVIVHVLDDNAIAFPRTVVRAGESSQAAIVEYFVSAGSGEALVVPFTQISASAASNTSYTVAQLLNNNSYAIAYQASAIERDATFQSSSVALGGSYARVRTDSRLVGKGANSRLDAVYLGIENQMHDFRTLQDHRAPKTGSDLLFKGVVAGTSHSVYSGLIRVEKGAAGTNAYQTNRNLVLSKGARADSVPNLEIEENDVRCSHASAVGPVDEEQQYYLESRGVPTPTAERLIVSGFLEQMVSRIPVAAVRDPLRKEVKSRLNTLLATGVA